MKSLFANIKTILIVILVAIILLQQQCTTTFDFNPLKLLTPTPIEGTVINTIETKWDTLKIDTFIYVPKWRTPILIEHDTIPTDVDTTAILEDYFSKWFQTDTINLDSIGNIVINDTVSKNKIISRTVIPSIQIPITTIRRDSIVSRNEFYYGLGIVGNKTQFSYLGGELIIRTKRKKIYGVGIGINDKLQPTFSGKLLWKMGK
jgi:hypothetical protein